jgi:tetratricopeptide (TPR) repeat protein
MPHISSARTALLIAISVRSLNGQSVVAADSAFQRADWSTASHLYGQLVRRDSADQRSRFRLGVALFEQHRFTSAIPAFERTSLAGFQRQASEFRMTRAYALLGRTDSALVHLQRAADAGIAPALVSAHADLASIRGETGYARIVQQLDDARFPCRRGDEAHQFDFWVGEWAVTLWQSDPSTAPVGHNNISADLEHCVILEAWTPTAGGKGRSINFWDTNRHAWRQVWISADGGSLDYEGQFTDGAMRFTGWTLGADGRRVLQKLTFFGIAADTVRQLFEASDDGGTTWKSTFDGRYVRLPNSDRAPRVP